DAEEEVAPGVRPRPARPRPRVPRPRGGLREGGVDQGGLPGEPAAVLVGCGASAPPAAMPDLRFQQGCEQVPPLRRLESGEAGLDPGAFASVPSLFEPVPGLVRPRGQSAELVRSLSTHRDLPRRRAPIRVGAVVQLAAGWPRSRSGTLEPETGSLK